MLGPPAPAPNDAVFPVSAGGCGSPAPQPIGEDVKHYEEHYKGLYASFRILSISADKQEAEFHVVSKESHQRAFRVHLSARSFRIIEDTQDGALCGSELETFEQVLGALDGNEAFANRLCSLVSDQLAQELSKCADLKSRVVAESSDGSADEANDGK
eukprot:TRINITY_DN67398_c0_g1_i1.p1 TRINITY_DN67398_c0_g1~~TRINITY_DN67398_c0_g1_i1.p1  ORF type:complete len:157 (-),score=33.56 TRINITY_DN67398_c0_g1_i1:205-675(-)